MNQVQKEIISFNLSFVNFNFSRTIQTSILKSENNVRLQEMLLKSLDTKSFMHQNCGFTVINFD